MKNIKLARISFSTVSMLLCAAVISSCGQSNESKRKDATAIGTTGGGTGQDVQVMDEAPNNGTTPQNGAPTANRPDGTPAPGTQVAAENKDAAPVGDTNTAAPTKSDETAAPIGRVTTETKKSDTSTKSADKKANDEKSNPKFTESAALKTGGKTGDLFYTGNGDDGIMELFRKNSTTVSAAQQEMNSNLAKAVAGAKLKSAGTDMNLDLALNESGSLKLYRLKAAPNGNRLKLTLISTTGGEEFQGGFLKCLEDSCDSSYAKIKISGAYTRIIFRSSVMNNHFAFQQGASDVKFDLWKSYITNTVQGSDVAARIISVKTSSYEVLNGKSAMGMQLLTQDNESVSLSIPLVAAEAGTVVNQATARTADLSVNYNLPSSAGKLSNLSGAMSETRLVNNNGRGQIRLKMIFPTGGIWMTLTRPETKTLKASDIEAFDAAIKF